MNTHTLRNVLLVLAALTGSSSLAPSPALQGGAPPSDDAMRMGSPPNLAEGLSEEQMWPAATAEGWAQPCLVNWQRSFEDALKVARAQQRPLLVAVNMDGEIASEHFAGVRYRDPEAAALINRYACVIASVYRHTPRDYDEFGQRVECPRFGNVTCGEHIEAERELYDKYFDGKRISPRHIVLDLDAQETLDVYYSWDTATVFTTFRTGLEGWPEPSPPLERKPLDLVRSSDVADRERLEAAYRTGTREERRAILEALIEQRTVDQVEVLRAAVFGLDLEQARLARRALARCDSEGALDLMAEALKAPLEAEERALLLAAVARLAESSPRARTLAAVQQGLYMDSGLVAADLELAEASYELESRRAPDLLAREAALDAAPRDPAALLNFAQGLVTRALETPDRKFADLLYEDARANSERAASLGAQGAEFEALEALIAAGRGQIGTARAHAVTAIELGLLREEGGGQALGGLSDVARARLLGLFAHARQRSIREAYRRGESWPPEWLSDVSTAYRLLAAGPDFDAAQLVEYQDFLRWIGASPLADEVLDDGLRRFPESALLHERLRSRLLWESGPQGLESDYARRLADAQASGESAPQLAWFAGYAGLVAAEQYRRRSEFEPALAAYERGLELLAESLESLPEARDSTAHFTALAHAGRARVLLERDDLEGSRRALLAALEARPDSVATADGLNLTPLQTARMLQARLEASGQSAPAAEIQAALDLLDPVLLEPPPSEALGSGRRRGPARPADAQPGGAGGRTGGN